MCASTLHLVFLVLHIYTCDVIRIMISYILLGIQYQITTSGINLFLSEKYENGIVYSKYSNISSLLSSLIWSALFQFYTNPTGEPPSELGEYGYLYYKEDVLKRYVSFTVFYYVCQMLQIFISAYFLNVP